MARRRPLVTPSGQWPAFFSTCPSSSCIFLEPGGAGWCGAVVLGDRVWWRSSAKGAQELHRLRMGHGLRRHPWHYGTGLLRPTGDRRDAGATPTVHEEMKYVPHRNGAAASPTGARTARRRHTPEHPRASACCWYVLRGENGEESPRCRRARARSFRQTTRGPSTCGRSFRVRSGLPPRSARASNLVGPVRDRIGLVGWRGLFQAVSHIGRK